MFIDVINENLIRITDTTDWPVIAISIGDSDNLASAGLGGGYSQYALTVDTEGVYVDDIYDVVKHATAFVGSAKVGELSVSVQETQAREPMNRFFTLLDGAEWDDAYPSGPAILWGNVVEIDATPGIYTSDTMFLVVLFQGDWEKEDLFDIHWDADKEENVVEKRC